jgi:hypothetical protein
MTYQVIQYTETDAIKVMGGLEFGDAEALKLRCEMAADKGKMSYEIHEEEAR